MRNTAGDIGTGGTLLTLVLLAGCNPVPVSVHPLSDAQSSQADTRLVGYWRQVDPDQSVHGEPETAPLAIDLGPAETHALEVVGLDLDRGKRVRVRRVLLWTTSVATAATKSGEASQSWQVMSVRLRDLEPEERPEGYWLLLYECLGPRRVRFYSLNPVLVAAAIESGKLAGRVRRNPRAGKPVGLLPGVFEPEFQEIRITAESAALRAYLLGVGKNCFDRQQPVLELRKISPAQPAQTRPEKLPAKPSENHRPRSQGRLLDVDGSEGGGQARAGSRHTAQWK
ncbi:MAG: hypothetical protein CMJ75_16225 [Planctomycetaceae bacterium]|nr:hypothetical protein [Planctomycetaceae bacterium]